MRHITLTAMCIGLFVRTGVVRADDPEPQEWCDTYREWLSRNQTYAAGGECPPMGACDDPELRDSWIPEADTPILTLRLRIHVFAEDDGSNPTAEPDVLEAQINKLNETFLPFRIQFNVTHRYIHDSEFRSFSSTEEFEMKSLYAENPGEQLNVFLVATSGFSRGTFPWDPAALTFLGGILLHEGHVSPSGTTFSHEVGHNLGLWHTHHGVSEVGGCRGCHESPNQPDSDLTGDRCSDTPPTPTNFSCFPPGGQDSCTESFWGDTDYRNYMGYAPSLCRDRFSIQQAGRMHCWSIEVLEAWVCDGCASTGACCTETSPGAFECTEVFSQDCDGGFMGEHTTCDELAPADRCDCNGNSVIDFVDINEEFSADCSGNLIPDECEPDCNDTGEADSCDILDGVSGDCNLNGEPDECEPDEDCNGNGIQDVCDVFDGTSPDCNGNGVPDNCEVEAPEADCNDNGVPDDCEPDCNDNGVADECDILSGSSLDIDENGVPDDCQKIIFVAASAKGADNGSSWTNAFTDIQDAIASAAVGDRIFIAQGVYKPSLFGDRVDSFELRPGVRIFGGFAGPGQGDPGARDLEIYPTIFSGDLGGNDNGFTGMNDNSIHVVTAFGPDIDASTVLDGVTITGGNASLEFFPHDAGGGMRLEQASPTIRRCVFERNMAIYGAGVELFDGADARFEDCLFRNNRSQFRGGGAHVNGSESLFDRCRFIANTASNSGGGIRAMNAQTGIQDCFFASNEATFGGAVVGDDGFTRIENSVFVGNRTEEESGAVHFWMTDASVGHSVFYANVAEGGPGGGLRAINGSFVSIFSSIFRRNADDSGASGQTSQVMSARSSSVAVNFSNIQGGWQGIGANNIDVDPLFRDPDGADSVLGTLDDDFSLFKNSPCVDAAQPAGGNNPLPPTDAAGHPRVLCGMPDIGAYETGVGDVNCDNRLALSDFAGFHPCVQTGAIGPDDDACVPYDFDGNARADLLDFARFQSDFTGQCDIAWTLQPVDTETCALDPFELSASAETPLAGGVSITWRRDDRDILNPAGSIYAIESASPGDAGEYRAIAEASCGDVKISEPAILSVNDPRVEFVLQPLGGDFCAGESLFLVIDATGLPDFQWYRDGEPIESAVETFLFIPALTLDDAGTYVCRGSNNCNEEDSAAAVVTVMDCP